MLKLICRIYCESRRTDEPELPKFFCDFLAVWMHQHDVIAMDLSLEEVTDYEQ